MKNTRRAFLKKVAYSAPVVASLGMLVEPATASAHRDPFKECKSKINRCKTHMHDHMEEGMEHTHNAMEHAHNGFASLFGHRDN